MYIPPRRRQIGGRLLDNIVGRLSDTIRNDCNDEQFSRTLQLDGWDSAQLQNLVNFLMSTYDSEEYLGDVDLTGKDKSAPAMADLVLSIIDAVEVRYPPKNEKDPVVLACVTDNPSSMQAMRRRVKEQRSRKVRFFTYSCWLHGISKLLEDIWKLPFFRKVNAENNLVTVAVRNKQFLHSSVRGAQQTKELRQHFTDSRGRLQIVTTKRQGATRMGSCYYSIKRNIHLNPAFNSVSCSPQFDKKCGISKANSTKFAEKFQGEQIAIEGGMDEDSQLSSDAEGSDGEGSEAARAQAARKPRCLTKQEKYAKVKFLMKSDVFKNNSQVALDYIRPIMRVLKQSDLRASQNPFVWDTMAKLCQIYESKAESDDSPIPLSERDRVSELCADRWAYFHDPVHSAGYCLNPRFHSHDHFGEDDVKGDFEDVICEYYGVEFHYVGFFMCCFCRLGARPVRCNARVYIIQKQRT